MHSDTGLFAAGQRIYLWDWVQNRINGLYYVDPMQVSAEIGSDPIFKTARFFIGGNSYREHEIMRVLRNTRDGVTGVGVVAEAPPSWKP